MQERVIHVDIGPGGRDIKIEPKEGFTDDTCLKATASLEEALGTVQERDLKPEAYNKEQEIARLSNKG